MNEPLPQKGGNAVGLTSSGHHHDQVKNIERFITGFGQVVRKEPIGEREFLGDYNTRVLRARLVLEEALEICNALGFEVIDGQNYVDFSNRNKELNREEIKISCLEHSTANEDLGIELVLCDVLTPNRKLLLDGITDLDYVSKGTAITYGLQNLLVDAENIVHESNMTKFWTRLQIEDAQIANVNFDLQHDITLNQLGKYVVRTKEGKVVKPPTFKAPDFSTLLPKEVKK